MSRVLVHIMCMVSPGMTTVPRASVQPVTLSAPASLQKSNMQKLKTPDDLRQAR